MSNESTNITTDDSSTDHSSSSSSNYNFSSTSIDNESSLVYHNKNVLKRRKNIEKWCFWILISCINGIILFVAVCFLIISTMKMMMMNNKNNIIDEIIVKGEKYQMIYHNNMDDGDVINEIVEMDLDFEGDFYSFEDEEGSGIIVKLDKEGEEYKMCADQCICSVECQYDNECGFGMECNEYKCMESSKNRKETISEERRIAQAVVITIPLFVCVYGFFSSLILAQNYAKNTLEANCEKKCPPNFQSASTSEVKTETTKNNRIVCKGRCKVNMMEDLKKLPFFNIVFSFCRSSTYKNVYTIEEFTIPRATEIFTKEMEAYCTSRVASGDRWILNDNPCVVDSVSCR